MFDFKDLMTLPMFDKVPCVVVNNGAQAEFTLHRDGEVLMFIVGRAKDTRNITFVVDGYPSVNVDLEPDVNLADVERCIVGILDSYAAFRNLTFDGHVFNMDFEQGMWGTSLDDVSTLLAKQWLLDRSVLNVETMQLGETKSYSKLLFGIPCDITLKLVEDRLVRPTMLGSVITKTPLYAELYERLRNPEFALVESEDAQFICGSQPVERTLDTFTPVQQRAIVTAQLVCAQISQDFAKAEAKNEYLVGWLVWDNQKEMTFDMLKGVLNVEYLCDANLNELNLTAALVRSGLTNGYANEVAKLCITADCALNTSTYSLDYVHKANVAFKSAVGHATDFAAACGLELGFVSGVITDRRTLGVALLNLHTALLVLDDLKTTAKTEPLSYVANLFLACLETISQTPIERIEPTVSHAGMLCAMHEAINDVVHAKTLGASNQ